MDKRRSIINISTSIVSHTVLLIIAIFVRCLLIQYIGNDVNGLSSLYTSIIGMLAVAELGIGRAIVYSMYSPIVDGDQRAVTALFNLYKKLYRIIGGIIFLGGLLVMPFLPHFISDYEVLDVNVYITYLLTLISVVLTYLYSAKTSLIEAHKDNYITTGIATIAHLCRYALQVASILIFRSFVAFLICQIIGTVIIWILTEIVARKKYPDIINTKERVDEITKKEISKNVKAMVMHKVGTIMVQSVDSMIISAFIGVVILGKYSNYTYIAATMVGIITLFFTPVTSVIGHLCAEGNRDKSKGYFDYFYCLNYVLGVVFFLGYYAVIDSVVALFFGPGLSVSHAIAFIITLNQFIQYMRNASLLFRNASGTFYYDRWKPIAEGVVNLILSLLFVMVFPEELQVVGVIIATIITNLLICDAVEPFVVFKYVFGQKPGKFYIKNYSYIALFTLALILMTYLIRPVSSPITGIILNGFISISVSLITLGIVAIVDKAFRAEVCIMGRKVLEWSGRVRRR
ncbi:lipopolysaccharide biosynthesis protein [Oribacterium sp. NK2B42]|uniref:lipopolysaccharide biosynthesis protein n=1 Tax=Oribacterium sp. NK2B42 TaxID=689781 RepID=UPI0003F64511|nr:hypothetical protein [Oribacterium sp. NK2B42]